MCDLINRQQAIDQLHQSYNLLDAEQRLEALPSAQPHWIPFAEMMPAFGESVLVQFDDDDMDILTFPNIYKRLKRVAWMPLPKPYGGESDE